MTKISVSLPDELVNYIDERIDNRSALIEQLLRQWQQQQQDIALAEACMAIDELELGWEPLWQDAAITDWEASGL